MGVKVPAAAGTVEVAGAGGVEVWLMVEGTSVGVAVASESAVGAPVGTAVVPRQAASRPANAPSARPTKVRRDTGRPSECPSPWGAACSGRSPLPSP